MINDYFSIALHSHTAVNRHRQLQNTLEKKHLLCQIYLSMWLAPAG